MWGCGLGRRADAGDGYSLRYARRLRPPDRPCLLVEPIYVSLAMVDPTTPAYSLRGMPSVIYQLACLAVITSSSYLSVFARVVRTTRSVSSPGTSNSMTSTAACLTIPNLAISSCRCQRGLTLVVLAHDSLPVDEYMFGIRGRWSRVPRRGRACCRQVCYLPWLLWSQWVGA
jgi:hypothetical protein